MQCLGLYQSRSCEGARLCRTVTAVCSRALQWPRGLGPWGGRAGPSCLPPSVCWTWCPSLPALPALTDWHQPTLIHPFSPAQPCRASFSDQIYLLTVDRSFFFFFKPRELFLEAFHTTLQALGLIGRSLWSFEKLSYSQHHAVKTSHSYRRLQNKIIDCCNKNSLPHQH